MTTTAPTLVEPTSIYVAWHPMHTASRDGSSVILCLGDTIPDIPYVRTGSFLDGPEAEELGYREYAKYGGWLIFDPNCECFHMVDFDEPRGWIAMPVLIPAPVIIEARGRRPQPAIRKLEESDNAG